MNDYAQIILACAASLAIIALGYMAFAFGYSLFQEARIDYDNFQKYKNYWKEHHFEKEDR